MPWAKYYIKDSKWLTELEDDSVDLLMFSPPQGEVVVRSTEFAPVFYVALDGDRVREWYRVVKPGGFFLLNVGLRMIKKDEVLNKFNFYTRNFYPSLFTYTVIALTDFIPIGNYLNLFLEGGSIEAHDNFMHYVPITTRQHWILFAKEFWELPEPKTDVVWATGTPTFVTNPAVAKEFIEFLTKEGDHVCDPFAGTGTIGKVSNQLGRNATMYDITQKYLEDLKEELPHLEVEIIEDVFKK